ncbi:MAG: AhpC/TSA family protein [Deltaproteobacteria bacterium]|nr:AhpC/TSA family protein [Deltaproteobacteria bacterium]
MQLHRQVDKIHESGAELVVVGSGNPSFILGFREITGFLGPLYTDPSLAAYEAARLRRGAWRLFSPAALPHLARALKGGFKQGRIEGDATQQGGVLVIRPPGEVLFWHVSKVPGDNASPDDVLSALSMEAKDRKVV